MESERWPSGRRHSPAKGAYGPKPVSRVRIPLSPPSKHLTPFQSASQSGGKPECKPTISMVWAHHSIPNDFNCSRHVIAVLSGVFRLGGYLGGQKQANRPRNSTSNPGRKGTRHHEKTLRW